MAKMFKRPPFRWKDKFVAIRTIRLSATEILYPGDDYPQIRKMTTMRHFNEGRIGPKGSDYAEQQIRASRKGKVGRPRNEEKRALERNQTEAAPERQETEEVVQEPAETKPTEPTTEEPKIERQGKRFIVGDKVFYKEEKAKAHLETLK